MKNEVKRIPLGAGQDGLFRYYGHLPASFMNVAARIDIETEVDEAKMLEALRLTVTRLPYCALHILKEGKDGYSQYISTDEPKGIEILDYSDKSKEWIDKALYNQAAEAFPNGGFDTQLYYIKLLRMPGGKHTVFFRVHHGIMDAFALMYMISYFDKVYAALTQGKELPPPGMSPERDIEDSWKYNDSKRAETDRAWWTNQLKDLQFTSINGLGSPEFVKGKAYGKGLSPLQHGKKALSERIPRKLVDAVNRTSLEYNVAPQIFYMLALRTYLGKVSGTEDVTIDATVARRATLVQKGSGLSRANIILIRSVIPEDLPYSDAIRKLSVVQRESYRHSDFLVTEVGKILKETQDCPAGTTFRTAEMTYQPYFDIENTAMKFTCAQVAQDVTSIPLYMNIMPLDSTGDLWAFYTYAYKYTKLESVQRYHAFMLKFIEMGIANPDMTIKELTDACM